MDCKVNIARKIFFWLIIEVTFCQVLQNEVKINTPLSFSLMKVSRLKYMGAVGSDIW